MSAIIFRTSAFFTCKRKEGKGRNAKKERRSKMFLLMALITTTLTTSSPQGRGEGGDTKLSFFAVPTSPFEKSDVFLSSFACPQPPPRKEEERTKGTRGRGEIKRSSLSSKGGR
jgi:hypothetical protein